MKKNKIKTIAIIPARLKSSRFPEKALFPILNKSLIQRTYESVLKCAFLDEVYIATDSYKILEHIKKFQGKALLTSSSCKNGTQRLLEAVNKYNLEADIFFNIQGDNPCIEKKTILQTLEILKQDENAHAATACAPISRFEDIFSPHIVKCVFDQNQKALYFSRSPIPFSKNLKSFKNFKNLDKTSFYHHIGIYAYRSSFLKQLSQMQDTFLQKQEDLEQLKILEYGCCIKVAIVKEAPLGVDIPEDIKKVERFLCQSNTFSSQEA